MARFSCVLICSLAAVAARAAFAESPPTYVGYMNQENGGVTLNALTVGANWAWRQKVLCTFPNASVAMFGAHQSSYAPRRGLLYKGIVFDDQQILRVKVDREQWTFDCAVLSVSLPITAGEYRMDIFPDQEPDDPKPTLVGALNGSPSSEYILYELHDEDSDKPALRQVMVVKLQQKVRQVFGSYYDSRAMLLHIGFNVGHLFWDVPPCWMLTVDVGRRRVLNATFYAHESGYDLWYAAALDSFFVPTMDDCAVNKTSCVQGVRPWSPRQGLGAVRENFCVDGSACFTYEVGYGYAFNPRNLTAVMYGGVSGWWHYDVVTGAKGQYEYSTVFVDNAVYVGGDSH